jgi:hypothetical protein
MVHLLPLPGAPLYAGSLAAVLESALRDARAIAAGGCDGVIVENFGDKPFTKGRVASETVAAMTRVVAEIVGAVAVPVGVNVLRNDAHSALAIAAATGAAFIRVNIHTGAMLTDQGLIEGEAYETLRRRAAIAPQAAIFADHLVKHAVPLGDVEPLQSAKDLRLRGLADALIVTGAETGAAPDAARLRALRAAVDAPLLIGSGLTAENADAFSDADAAIVGTSIKRDARVDAEVEQTRVAQIVRAFKGADGRSKAGR